MPENRFDAASRDAALGKSAIGIIISATASAFGAVFGAREARAQAGPVSIPCTPEPLNTCMMSALNLLEKKRANCAASVETIVEVGERPIAYGECIQAIRAETWAAILKCHDQSCGIPGWYCGDHGAPRNPVCCPRGMRPVGRLGLPSPQAVCQPACGNLRCAPGLRFNTDFCTCDCGIFDCPPGQTVDRFRCACL
jgi:hypothetical protein